MKITDGMNTLHKFAAGTVLLTLSILAFPPLSGADSHFVTLNSFNGKPAVDLNVWGGGYDAGETVRLTLDGDTTGLIGYAPVEIPAGGDTFFGPVPFHIPVNAPQGPLVIRATGLVSGRQATNSYYVEPFTPAINFNAPVNTPGGAINLNGQGFAPAEMVTLSLAGATSTVAADSAGNFTGANLIIPSVSPGTYLLTGTGNDSGAAAIGYFYVGNFYPAILPTAYFVPAGGNLSFSGSGFMAGGTIDIFVGASSTPAATFAADGAGGFTGAGALAVPFSLAGTVATFNAAGRTSGATAATMVAIGQLYPSAIPSAYYIPPGQVLNFSGSGFFGNEAINILEDSSVVPLSTFNATSGAFSNAGGIVIPFGWSGTTRNFRLLGATSGGLAMTPVAVGALYATINPSAYYVPAGSSFTLGGNGFGASETIHFFLGGTESTSTLTTASNGSFTAAGPFLAPYAAAGSTLNIMAAGQTSGASANTVITVGQLYPVVSPSDYYLLPFANFSVVGSGFAPNEPVAIALGTSTLATPLANSFGIFVHNLIAPGVGGPQHYVFTGQNSGAAAALDLMVAAIFPVAQADNYYAPRGASVNVQGSQFLMNEPVTIAVNGTTTLTAANASGTTPWVPITLPFATSTSVQVVLTGGLSGASALTEITLAPFGAQVAPSTWYASPGSAIDFSGSGFAINENVSVTVNGGAATSTTANGAGAFNLIGLTLPFGGSPATYVFTGALSGASVSVPITLTPFYPNVTPSTWYGSPGTPLSFLGSGFGASETVNLSAPGSLATSTLANGAGAFNWSGFALPFVPGPAHYSFTGQLSGANAAFDLTVAGLNPWLFLDQYYFPGGTPLLISGRDFAGNETVSLAVNGMQFATTTADGGGDFDLPLAAPFGTPGAKTLTGTGEASGAVGTSGYTLAEVYPGIALGAYAGPPGGAVTFIGTGYFANEPIEILTDRTGGTVVRAFSADGSGAFTDAGYVLPGDFMEGLLTFTIRGTQSFTERTIIFYVTGG